MEQHIGFFTTDFRLARVAELMTKAAQQVFIVADPTKFGKRSLAPFGSIEKADVIITSEGIDENVVQALKQKGTEVLVATLKGGKG